MPSRSHSRRQTLRLGSALTLVLAGGRLRTANAKGQILPEGDAYAPWGLWNDPSLRGVPASSCSTKAKIGAHSMRRSLKRPRLSSMTRQ
jgi:hypothetical protein